MYLTGNILLVLRKLFKMQIWDSKIFKQYFRQYKLKLIALHEMKNYYKYRIIISRKTFGVYALFSHNRNSPIRKSQNSLFGFWSGAFRLLISTAKVQSDTKSKSYDVAIFIWKARSAWVRLRWRDADAKQILTNISFGRVSLWHKGSYRKNFVHFLSNLIWMNSAPFQVS